MHTIDQWYAYPEGYAKTSKGHAKTCYRKCKIEKKKLFCDKH
jgi:hypothetical protein